MKTLRERKKSDRNLRIQNSALALFGNQGFQKTTISQIAAKADLGVGTVYNYYQSKEEILFSIIQDYSSEYVSKLEKILNNADKNVAESIAAFIGVYLESFSIYNKTIWRELIAAGFIKNQPAMMFVDKIDLVFLNKFSELLDKFKQRKLIQNDIQSSEIVSIIYNVLMANILRYLANEKMTLMDLKNIVVKQIKIILKIDF
jgi:Transcriptional regulator